MFARILSSPSSRVNTLTPASTLTVPASLFTPHHRPRVLLFAHATNASLRSRTAAAPLASSAAVARNALASNLALQSIPSLHTVSTHAPTTSFATSAPRAFPTSPNAHIVAARAVPVLDRNPSLDLVKRSNDRALPSATMGVAKYDTYRPAAHVVTARSAARRARCAGVRRFRSASSSFVAYAVASRVSFAADDDDEVDDDVTDRLDARARDTPRRARATTRISMCGCRV